MEVNIHDAKTNLSRLIAAVEAGEEVVIARNGKPAVKLVRLIAEPRKSRGQMLGSGIGRLRMAEDAFSTETDLHTQQLFHAEDSLLMPVDRPPPGRKAPA